MTSTYTIYTDGSYEHSYRMCGSSFVVISPSGKSVAQEASHYKATTSSWNIEAEIKAVQMALDWVEKNNIKDILFVCDLINCVNHINGKWKGKQSQSIHLYSRCERLRSQGVKLEAEWIEGHSGDVWNELCDSLAKIPNNLKRR